MSAICTLLFSSLDCAVDGPTLASLFILIPGFVFAADIRTFRGEQVKQHFPVSADHVSVWLLSGRQKDCK